MKNKILLLLFSAFAFVANAKCPTSVTYSSPNFTFTYPGATPSGAYNQLRVTISSGTGSGNSYLLAISSNSGTTIVTDNSSGSVDGSSVASKIEYYLSGSPTSVADCKQSTPLPVKLISFKGEFKDKKVYLTWSTASEINNDYFLIERSNDGIKFETLGTVKGNGNSNEIIAYAFLDIRNPGGFYRLKQVDYNGEFEYSSIIKVSTLQPEKVCIYPNPFVNEINLVIPEFEGMVEIVSMEGKVLFTSTEKVLKTDFLKPGIYLLKVGNFQYRVAKN